MEYDNLGNPTRYKNRILQWQKGRQLARFGEYEFEYDGFGKRTKLSLPNETDEEGTIIKQGYEVEYFYDRDGRLIKQSNGLEFFYDHTGVMGLKYEEKYYFYRRDTQKNIIGILDNTGKVVVRYTYDSWGNHRRERTRVAKFFFMMRIWC